jgi:hypothetical protein
VCIVEHVAPIRNIEKNLDILPQPLNVG